MEVAPLSLLPYREKAKTNRKPISVRLDPVLREKLETTAKSRGHSMTDTVVRLVDFGLDLNQELDPSWAALEGYARKEKLSIPAAVAKLVGQALKKR